MKSRRLSSGRDARFIARGMVRRQRHDLLAPGAQERIGIDKTKKRHGERGPGVKTLLTKAALDAVAADPDLEPLVPSRNGAVPEVPYPVPWQFARL
jgi:hypothetical protein